MEANKSLELVHKLQVTVAHTLVLLQYRLGTAFKGSQWLLMLLDIDILAHTIHTQFLGANVSGLAAYGPPAATPEGAEPFPLRWGEVIPLHFLTPSLLSHSQIMIISQPSRRYKDSVSMVPELLTLGGCGRVHHAGSLRSVA